MFSRLLPSPRPLLRRHFTRKLPHWRVETQASTRSVIAPAPLPVLWASSGWYPAIDYHLIENRKGSLSASIAGKLRQFGRVHGLRAWNRPSEHPEFQSSWERDKPAVCRVVDLGKSQPTEQVNALRKGKASPLRTSNASSKTSSPSSLPEQFSRTRSRLLLWFERFRSCHRGTTAMNTKSTVSSGIAPA